jgi:hypothetical protein
MPSEAVAARSDVKACTVYIIMSRRSTAGISRQSIFHYNIYNLSSSVQVCVYIYNLASSVQCVCRARINTHCTCACRGVRCHQSMCTIRQTVAAPETAGSFQTWFSCRRCYAILPTALEHQSRRRNRRFFFFQKNHDARSFVHDLKTQNRKVLNRGLCLHPRTKPMALLAHACTQHTNLHRIQTPTLPTSTVLTFTYTQVLWFLSCLTRSRTSGVTTR